MLALLAEVEAGQPVRGEAECPWPKDRHQPGCRQSRPDRGDRRGRRLRHGAKVRRATDPEGEVGSTWRRAAPAGPTTQAAGVRRKQVCLDAGSCHK
jgi:hypothetical protein